jgi:hypothetical protein
LFFDWKTTPDFAPAFSVSSGVSFEEPLIEQAVRFALDKDVSDLSALSACPLLENIDADNTLITSMTAFTGMQNLKHLYIRQTTVESLSGIEGFPHLEQIGLGSVLVEDPTPLLNLSQLKEAYLDEGLREKAEKCAASIPQGFFYLL